MSDGKADWQLTPEEVRRLAEKMSSPHLYAAWQMYAHGQPWEQCIQAAAIAMAKDLKTLSELHAQLLAAQPFPLMNGWPPHSAGDPR